MGVQADREARLAEIKTLAAELIEYADEDDRLIHLADASYVMQLIADVPWLVAELEAVTAENTQLAAAIEVLSGNDYLWRTGQIDAETAMEGNLACVGGHEGRDGMSERRYDIHGRVLTDSIRRTKCHDCGMGTVDAAEWHPYEACETFRRTHDSREVLRMLRRTLEAGDAPWLAGAER